jgi:hypothetical protein
VNPWSSLDPWTTLILVATLKLNQVFSSEMRIITGILLLFFFAFLAVVPVEAGPQSGAPFWSLALQDGLVEPNGQLFPANCSAYLQSGIIQPYQYDVCRNNSYLLSAIARGLRRAVAACQKTFKNGSWNCTAFQGAHLLGKAIETKGGNMCCV